VSRGGFAEQFAPVYVSGRDDRVILEFGHRRPALVPMTQHRHLNLLGPEVVGVPVNSSAAYELSHLKQMIITLQYVFNDGEINSIN
jgi:hypothetical protein